MQQPSRVLAALVALTLCASTQLVLAQTVTGQAHAKALVRPNIVVLVAMTGGLQMLALLAVK
jgi:hypothetical protein